MISGLGALLAVAACAGNAPAPVAPSEPPVDAHRAESDAKGLVTEIYQAIGHAQPDSLFSLLADGVVTFGPRRLDAAVDRANALILLNKATGRVKHTMRSTGLSIVPSPGGHSAWMFDVVYADTQPLAITGVLTSNNNLWAVQATMMAAIASRSAVKAESSKDAIVPPGAAAVGQIDPATVAVIEQFKRGLTDASLWAAELSAGDDAMWIGPTSGELAHGKDAIARVAKARQKSNVRLATTGDFIAGRTPDGALVWLSVSTTRVADDAPDPLPQRIFAVYAKAGAGWRLTSLHEALALDEPGSGTAFKKIIPASSAPPAGPPPPPAPPPASDAAAIELETTASKDPKPAAAAAPSTAKKVSKTKRAKTRTPAAKSKQTKTTTTTAKKKKAKKQPATPAPAPASDDGTAAK